MFRTALLPIMLLLLAAPVSHAASAGDLDPSFDGDGKAILPLVGTPRALLVQPDGKLVLAGTADGNLGAWRLNPDGSPDRGFDGDGVAVADFGGAEFASAAALQPDGKLVVVGGNREVARFTAGGPLDKTFGPGGEDGDGKVIVTAGGDGLSTDAVVVQADGKLALVGSRWNNQNPADFVITRLRSDGAPDIAKAPEPADFGGEDWVVTGAAAPGGKILAAGTTRAAGAPQSEDVLAVARWNADGSLDKTFAETGKKKLGPGKPVVVVAQPDGGVLVVLRAENGDPSVLRLTNAGEVDGTFGDAGTAKALFDGEKLADAFAAAVRPDGRAYVAGTPVGATAFGVARLGTTGVLDPRFGLGGTAAVEFDTLAVAVAAALQPDGKLVVAGATVKGVAARLTLVRLFGDATPPPATAEPQPAVQAPLPRCGGRVATIVGTPGRDTLRGTRRADVIVALGGNDKVLARGGNDRVCGGAGNDGLNGGPGRDVLTGGAGRDRLTGGGGPDRCVGSGGLDRAAGCERRSSL
jgi:uncharacterized delta-60 repeat protein